MSVRKLSNIALIILLVSFCLCAGCIQRKLTIVTEPAGALVELNDEEIGTSPVSVGFEWYGDYNIRITKEGYQTLSTHKNLKRPMHDFVGADFLADVLTTKIDEYTWNFTLEPYQPIDKDELVKSAVSLQKETMAETRQSAYGKTKRK